MTDRTSIYREKIQWDRSDSTWSEYPELLDLDDQITNLKKYAPGNISYHVALKDLLDDHFHDYKK